MIRLSFVCERAFTSSVIARFSAGHFSHVDALMPSGQLFGARSDRVRCRNGMAAPRGVHIRPPAYAKFNRQTIFNVPATKAQQHAFWSFLWPQIGKPYDWRVIWAFALGRDWREQDSWICSELQAAALEASGVLPKLYLAANKITPVSLALALSAIGATAVEII